MFRGVYEHQIDAKGRTSLPARLRETLAGAYDERLILTTALDPCLHAYPVREWEALETALGKRSPMEPGVKTLMRLYVAAAQECPLDKMGRVLIPPYAAGARGAGEGRRLGGDGEGDGSVEPHRLGQGPGGRPRRGGLGGRGQGAGGAAAVANFSTEHAKPVRVGAV